jgi:hypothetical protein
MKAALCLVVVLLGCVYQSYGWGEEGHKIVAQIAADRLNGAANKVVNLFIGSTGETLTGMAPLPDDYDHTPAGRWSEPCHFCNLPRNATHFVMDYCGDFCVVRSIQNYSSIITKTSSNPTQCNFDQSDGVEPCALEFLVHFVGDVHQPLHVGYGDDRGGNEVRVYWFSGETNLHEVWDDKIIQKWNSDYSSAAQELEQWISDNPDEVTQFLSNMDPVSWADESFQYVQNTCYNFGSSEENEGEAAKVGAYPRLGTAYYDRNLPIVKQRLVAAGVRLAALLNSDLSQVYMNLVKNKFNAMKIIN